MGHVLVVMLALILERELEKRLSKISMEVSHAIAAMNGWGLIRQSLGSIRISQQPHPIGFNPRYWPQQAPDNQHRWP